MRDVAKRFALTTCMSLCAVTLVTAAQAESQGQKVYTQGGASPAAMACTTCHAANGMGVGSTGFPRLAGLPAGYLVKQIEDFRSGKRANAVMQPIAMALGDAEVKAVAGYVADLDATVSSAGLDAMGSIGSAAEKLVKQGDWSRNIPACVACHGEGSQGVGDSFPPLIGQSGTYITAQLNGWRNGTRKNDPNDLMSHIASSLSDAEIKDISAYFDNLNGEKSQ